MTDKLSFLSGDDSAEHLDAPVVEPIADPTVEVSQESPARDDQGRFAAPAEPGPDPITDPVAESVLEPQPSAVAAPEPGHVPLSAVLDEREKRQAAERELAELRKQAAPPRPAPQQQQAPDRWEDPEAYEAYQAEQYQGLILTTKLDLSEDMARDKHGDEIVEAAKTWALERFAQSPAYQHEVLSHRNPYGKAVLDYQRDQVASQLKPEDLTAFRAWQASQTNPNPAPAAPTPALAPPRAAPLPPRSAAHAPSAGGPAHVATGPGQAFGSVFK